MLTGYKWTRADGMSWHDAGFGPYAIGKTLTVDGAVMGEPCGTGLHFSPRIEDAVGYGKFPGLLWAVESDGPILGQDATKIRVASLRVVSAIEKPAWIVSVEAVLAEIALIPWGKPTVPPLPEWRHYPTRAAAGDAARAAAGDAARAAAGDATWDAARAAARAATLDAARAAAGDAARAATWDAAGDAALSAQVAICADLPIAQIHRDHAAARMDVWKRGYALYCDVNGILYTYDWPK